MVAVVTGNTLGLAVGSSSVLGSSGQSGSASVGRGGDLVYVNAKTGNLVVQDRDELLIGRGPDIGVVRTYNSNGSFDFDNNDDWQVSLYRKLGELSGGKGVNTTGSTIRRYGADGSQTLYTYDITQGKYVNRDGGGAYDTLSYSRANDRWTWTDGDSQVSETYDAGPTNGEWRITGKRDLDNNALTYSYDANGLITQVSDANGETTKLIYDAATRRLTSVQIVANKIATTRIRYSYDNNGRLSSVSTDLTPADGSIADGNTYATSYTYDGSSNRIASIINSNGTKASFTYDNSFRIKTVDEGNGKISSFTYNAGNTTVTDPLGQVSIFTYDSNGNLTRLQGPAGSGQDVRYTYNTNGDLIEIRDSRGNTITQIFDGHGNLTRRQDSAGNVVERAYNSANQLVRETVYAVADPDGSGQALAPQSTHYVYSSDNKQHLRFVVSAEGRVTEYLYNAYGQQEASLVYTDGVFTIGQAAPAEADLASWVATQDLSRLQRTDHHYDQRGQMSFSARYEKTRGSSGVGDWNSQVTYQTYTYSAGGLLLQKYETSGPTADANTQLWTTYAYDGLGRTLSFTQVDAEGSTARQTLTTFNDAANRSEVTLNNGLKRVSTYDTRGLLVSQVELDGDRVLSTQTHQYDADGRLRISTDPNGNHTYYLYDSAGRKVGEIDAEGSLTEWSYDGAGLVTRNVRYATTVSANLASLFAADAIGNIANVTLADVRPSATTSDQVVRRIYDQAGRLRFGIDAGGAVTETRYDGAGRVLKSINYAHVLNTPAGLDRLGREALPSDIQLLQSAPVTGQIGLQVDAASDRISRNLYDNDGLLRASLDAEGYLTEVRYDAAGRQIQTIRYAAPTAAAVRADGNLASLIASANAIPADNIQSFAYYNGMGQLAGSLDAEGYFTTYDYDSAGNRTSTTRYANRLVGTAVAGTAPQILASAPGSVPAGGYVLTSSGDQVSTAVWTRYGQLDSETAIDGTITKYSYDEVGNRLSSVVADGEIDSRSLQVRYDKQGHVTQELSALGANALAALGVNRTQAQIDAVWATYGSSHTYDAAGRRIKTVDANGNVSLFFYDADNRLTHSVRRVRNPANAGQWVGEVSARQYNALGQLKAEIGYANRIAASAFAALTGGDEAQIKAKGVLKANAALDSRTDYTYELTGKLAVSTVKLNAGESSKTSRSYNAFGQLSALQTAIDATRTRREEFIYDRRGLLLVDKQDVSWSGNPNASNKTTHSSYDAFGRVETVTDGRGISSTVGYDKLGRQIQTVTASGSLNIQQSSTFDAFGRMLTQTDAMGRVTTYGYAIDKASGKTTLTITSPEKIVTKSVSDRYGQTLSVADGLGNETRYVYDANGNLLTTKHWVKASNSETTLKTDSYDTAGLLLIESSDANGNTVAYAYDAANRLLTRTVDPNGLNLVTRYTYDAKGQAITETDPNGTNTRTDYDLAGRTIMVAVDPTGLNLRTQYSYDLAGQQVRVLEGYGTGTSRTTEYVYDGLGRRVLEIRDPSGLNLVTQYAYDANDNVVAKTEAVGQPEARTTRYVYDEANRLVYTIDALGAVSETQYDAEGRVTGTIAHANPIDVNTASQWTQDFSQGSAGLAGSGLNNANYMRLEDGRLVTQTQEATANTWPSLVGRRNYTFEDGVSFRAEVTTGASSAGRYLLIGATNTGNTAANTYRRHAANINGGVISANYWDPVARAWKGVKLGDVKDNTTYVVEVVAHEAGTTLYVYEKGASREEGFVHTLDYTDWGVMRSQLWTFGAPGRANATMYVDNLTETQPEPALWSQHFSQDASGLTGNGLNDPNYMKVENGRLVVQTQNVATTTYPSLIGQRLHAFDEGVTFHAEVTTDAKPAGRYLLLGAYNSGSTATNTYRRHAAYFSGGNLYAHYWDPAAKGWKSVKLGTSKNNTTYNVDVVTHAAGTTLYVYEKGQSREDGLVHTLNDTDWGVARSILHTVGVSGRANSAMYVDNLEERPAPKLELGLADVESRLAVDETQDRSNTYVYDKDGRQRFMIDALGGVTEKRYDAAGNVTRQIAYANPMSGTLAKGAMPSVGSTGTNIVTSGNDRITVYNYDALNRLTRRTEAFGTSAERSETWGYDKAGNTLRHGDARGNSEWFAYDAANRLIRHIDQAGYVTDTAWYDDGLKKSEKRWMHEIALPSASDDHWAYAGHAPNPQANNDATSGDRTTLFTYDKAGRMQTRTNAAGFVTRYAYDALGNLTDTTTAYGTSSASTLHRSYDPLGQVVTEIRAYGTSEGSVTRYLYDALGNQTTIVVADGTNVAQTTSQQFDRLGRKIGVTDSAGATTTTTYNAFGDIIKVVDANGNAGYFYTDAFGRVTLQVDPEGAVTETRYDRFGNTTDVFRYASKVVGSVNENIRPKVGGTSGTRVAVNGAADQHQQTRFDVLGRKLEVRTWWGANASDYYSERFTYDANDNLLTAQARNGAVTTYFYDRADREILSVNALGYATSNEYDAMGNLRREVRFADALSPATLAGLTPASDPAALVNEAGYLNIGSGPNEITRWSYLRSRQQVTFGTGNSFKGELTTGEAHNGRRLMLGMDNALSHSYRRHAAYFVNNTLYASWYDGTTYKSAQVSAGGDIKDNTTYVVEVIVESGGTRLYVYEKGKSRADGWSHFVALTDWTRSFACGYTYGKPGWNVTQDRIDNLRIANASGATLWSENFDRGVDSLVIGGEQGAITFDGQETQYTYDKLNRQVKEIGEEMVSYDPVTQTEKVVTPTKQFIYDARGNLIEERDARGERTLHYYDRQDRQVGQIDATGAYTRWSYDAAGNLISQTAYANPVQVVGGGAIPNGSAPQLVATAPTSGAYVLINGANDRTIHYSYDGIGRQTGSRIDGITVGRFNQSTQHYQVGIDSITTSTVYDAMGNVLKSVDGNGHITRTYYNQAGQQVGRLDALNHLTVWSRDTFGNVRQQTQYANAVANLTVTDATSLASLINHVSASADDRIIQYGYDKLNRVFNERHKRVASGKVNTTSGALTETTADAITRYAYDGLDNLKQQTDATGAVTDWDYDALGRRTQELKPGYTDYSKVSVRPTTDYVYDGLDHLLQEIERGRVTADDRVTTYVYGAGGHLAGQIDPTGALLQYHVDANGNITRKTLVGRLNSDDVASNDVTLYQYDGANRQIKSTDVSTGTTQETRYNAFGEITGKRTNGGGSEVDWPEFAKYDRLGRAWMNNSGDGVTKVYVYDAAGNATLKLDHASVDLSGLNLATILSPTATPGTNQTVSVYDARNQLVDTIQPAMNSSHSLIAIEQSLAELQGTSFAGIGGVTMGVAAGLGVSNAETMPANVGAVSISRAQTVSATLKDNYTTNLGSSKYALAYGSAKHTLTLNIPDTRAWGTDNVRVHVWLQASADGSLGGYSGNFLVPYQDGSATLTFSESVGADMTGPIAARNYRYTLYKQTAAGDVELGSYTGSATPPELSTYNNGAAQTTESSSTTVASNLVQFSGPGTASRLILLTRPSGQNVGWKVTDVPQRELGGISVPGSFDLDWSTWGRRSYEFRYVALDSNNNVINSEQGTMVLSNTAPAISQTAHTIGGAGRAFLDATGAVNFTEQGATAKTLKVSYRHKGTAEAWTARTLSAASIGGAFTAGWFKLSTSGLSGTYEYTIEARNAAGVVLNKGSGSFGVGNANSVMDPSGVSVQSSPSVSVAAVADGVISKSQTVSTMYKFSAGKWVNSFTVSGARLDLAIPDTSAWGGGNVRVAVSIAETPAFSSEGIGFSGYSGDVYVPNGQYQTSVIVPESGTSYGLHDQPFTLTFYKQTANGEVNLGSVSGTTSGSEAIITGTATDKTVSKTVSGGIGRDILSIRVQPANAHRVMLEYRLAGSNNRWSVMSVPPLKVGGTPLSGIYGFDWSSWTKGTYEVRQVTLDASGNVLNTGKGTMVLQDSTPSLTISNDLIGGAGRVFMDTNGALNFTEQGSAAKKVTIRYRAAGSAGLWSARKTLLPATVGGASTPGWFAFNPANYGLNGNVEYVLETRTASGQLLNTVAGRFTTGKVNSVTDLSGYQEPPVVAHFKSQPANAATMQLSWRPKGSSSAFTDVTLSKVYGVFDWDTSSVFTSDSVNAEFEYRYSTFDGSGTLINKAHGVIRLGTTPALLSHVNDAAPTLVSIAVPENNATAFTATQMVLKYRKSGTSNAYASVTLTRSDTSQPFVWDASNIIAPGTGGSLDYSYKLKDANGRLLAAEDGSTIEVTGTLQVGTTSGAELTYKVAGTTSRVNLIHRKQNYNAFGEVRQEIDGKGQVTDLRYNTLGKLVLKQEPTTTATLENGYRKTLRPTTRYTYDLAGRLVAQRDANGNLTTQALLPGVGSDGEGQVMRTFNPDGGMKETGYDIFGDIRRVTDEIGRRSDYRYDKAHRVIRIDRPNHTGAANTYDAAGNRTDAHAWDTYVYDVAGQRIRHSTTPDGTTIYTDKTDYDSLGRVTRVVTPLGRTTSYSYGYSYNNISGIGGKMTGGWQKKTTDASGRVAYDNISTFGQMTWHKDFGGHTFSYHYNNAGWLTQQNGSTGQNISTRYYDNGYVKSITDNTLHTVTSYEYDANGNRTYEAYGRTVNGNTEYLQNAVIKYDELNRVEKIVDLRAEIRYEYDAKGNRRRVWSYYHDGIDGSVKTQDYWYRYDQMDRFVLSMGKLNNATGVRGGSESDTSVSVVLGDSTHNAEGVQVFYDFAGQRKQIIAARDGHREDYSYSGEGYLESTWMNQSNSATRGPLASVRGNDYLGRTTQYQEFKSDGSRSYNRVTTYDADNRSLTQTGTDGTSHFYYYNSVTEGSGSNSSKTGVGELAHIDSTKDGTTTSTWYRYDYWDEAKQKYLTISGSNPDLKQNNKLWKSGISSYTYDVNGHMSSATDAGKDGVIGTADDVKFRYVDNAQGLTLRRDQMKGTALDKQHRYLYVNGQAVGDVGNDGDSNLDYAQALAQAKTDRESQYKNWKPIASADFDQNYQPINASYPSSTATSYKVRTGDTLYSIASAVWGDASLWYLIADANGLNANKSLTAGEVLTIPNKVTNVHNNAQTFKPYDAGKIIGDTSPTLPDAPPPPPPKHGGGCGGFAMILVAVVTVVVTIYTAGATAAAMSSVASTASTAGMSTMSIGAAALGGSYGAGGIAAAAIGSAVGNAVGQLTGIATGIQDKFNWNAVATSALSGGTTAYLGSTNLLNIEGLKGVGATMFNAAASNVVNQGINMLTGEQKSFSWSSVAVSAISAPVTAKLNNKMFGSVDGKTGLRTGNFAQTNPQTALLAENTVSALVSATTRMAIEGGHLQWESVAADALSGFVQSRVNAQRLATENSPKYQQAYAEASAKVFPATEYPSFKGRPTPAWGEEGLQYQYGDDLSKWQSGANGAFVFGEQMFALSDELYANPDAALQLYEAWLEDTSPNKFSNPVYMTAGFMESEINLGGMSDTQLATFMHNRFYDASTDAYYAGMRFLEVEKAVNEFVMALGGNMSDRLDEKLRYDDIFYNKSQFEQIGIQFGSFANQALEGAQGLFSLGGAILNDTGGPNGLTNRAINAWGEGLDILDFIQQDPRAMEAVIQYGKDYFPSMPVAEIGGAAIGLAATFGAGPALKGLQAIRASERFSGLMDNLAVTMSKAQFPVGLEFQAGRLYSGVPIDALKWKGFVPNKVVDINPSKTIGGRKIINSDLAGTTVKTKGGDVRFDSDGFPDFTPYSQKTVRVEGLTGDMANDVPLAMERAGMTTYDKSKYVWHHHQDAKTMMLVPKNVHSVRNGGVAHTGGRAVIQHNLANPNNMLNYLSPEELF